MTDDKARRDDAPDGSSSTAGGTSALTTVGELMEERRRYEAWLQALEARRGETPKHVFTRVHADYTARLETVISRLTTHADGLRTALTALATRLANLDEQQHRARDERAEAELRAHVGELSPDEWERLKAASEAEIVDLARKHAETAAELERTKALVADAERPATPVAPAPPVQAVPLAAAAGVSADADAEKAAPQEAPAESGKEACAKQKGFDELAFLHSVVDTPAANGAAKEPADGAAAPDTVPLEPSAPRQSAPLEPSAPRQSAPLEPSTLLEPSAPPAPPRAVPRSESAPAKPAAELTVNHGEPMSPKIVPKRGGALAANVSGNNPVILKDKGLESGKTLKCAECGALNYPTEWYCERCGAELASL